MSRFTRWSAVLGVVLAVSGAAHAAPMLTNGSFEQISGSSIVGWSQSGNVGTVTNQGETDGVRAVAFNGGQTTPNGQLWQDVSTVAGQKYYAEFDFRKFGGTGTAKLNLLVTDVPSNITLSSLAVEDTVGQGGSGLTQDYVTYDTVVNAIGTTTRVRFLDLSTGTVNFDPMLDRVSLNVLRNGSFEQGLLGWNLTGNAGVGGLSNVFNEGSSNGLDALQFNGGQTTPNAVVTQTFNTLAGQEYAVEFDFRKYGGSSRADLAKLLADIVTGPGDTVLASITVADFLGDGSSAANNPNFDHYYFKFRATGTQTTIRFFDQSSGTTNYDAVLDNVIISTIPEPTTAALAVLGLTALGLGRRRR